MTGVRERRVVRGGDAQNVAPRRAARVLAIAPLLLARPVPAQPSGPSRPATYAVMINGGSSPAINYQSHLRHLQQLVAELESRGIPRLRMTIFSADGREPAPDLAVRDQPDPRFWLVEFTRAGRELRPRTDLIDTRWDGVDLRPARKDALRHWFETTGRGLGPQDDLLLFVTDHGSENRDDLDNGSIALWQETLSVRELEGLLSLLPAGVRVVMLMSQCFSGSFASAMAGPGQALPSGRICGFFSAHRDRRAYGCYPEGRDKDAIGHAYRFIDALDRRATLSSAHAEVLVTDDTPDVPLRTSDVYLEKIVEEEARARGVETDVLADRLLAKAWLDRAAWEPEIRLLDEIGDAYGTFSPRTVAELRSCEKELPALVAEMEDYAKRWEVALSGVEEENLDGLVEAWPWWRERLDERNLQGLDVAGRKSLLAELLPLAEQHARERPDLWGRLSGLEDRARRASEARWRLSVRRAAMERMRDVLMGIAGRTLLAPPREAADADDRRVLQGEALARLDECEAFEPGKLYAASASSRERAAPRFPPLEEDRRLVEAVLPSWLGVRLRPVPGSLAVGRDLPAGASLLESVFPASPAQAAGLADGDIVLGTPDRPFTAEGQLREWAMTSPRGTPLALAVLRPGVSRKEDRQFEINVVLRALPQAWPDLPSPPKVGEAAPPLPPTLVPVRGAPLPDLHGRAHLVLFWATWCQPCKKAVPEVMALAAAKGYPVLAVTDEDPNAVAAFLAARKEPFPEQVAADPLRRSFVAFGVSGTPTLFLVDARGVVRYRQVGYDPARGLAIEGWSRPAP